MEMKIRIWQLTEEADSKMRILFFNYKSTMEHLKKEYNRETLRKSDYKAVFSGWVPAKTLEGIWTYFQCNKPEGYCGHTLSVSDLVQVEAGGEVEPGFYFVDSLGFQKVEPEDGEEA